MLRPADVEGPALRHATGVVRSLSLIVLVLMLAACQPSAGRKTQAQLVGTGMLAELSHAVKVEVVPGRGSADPERPYRWATVLHDFRVSCVEERPVGASCGAAVELYRTPQAAIDRVHVKRRDAHGGVVARRGSYVLRVSPRLDRQAASGYREAFLAVVEPRR